MRGSFVARLIAIVIASLSIPAGANEASRAKAEEALRICDDVDRQPAPDRARRLELVQRGIAAGEAAVAADARDARAHFALFCNLGKELEIAGLSWRSFGRLRRLQAEIERAQVLDPDDPDILMGRSEVLLGTPGPLGGDVELGETLIRRVLAMKPDHVRARLCLAKARAKRGAPDARAQAYEALALAKKSGTPRDQAEAQELLAKLGR